MEQPERKKLKPTYQPAPGLPPLPAGWTEHTAPTGHKYYYNAATQQSTYTRPAAPLPSHSPSPAPAPYSAPGYGAEYQHQAYQGGFGGNGQQYPYAAPAGAQGFQGNHFQSWNEGQRKPFHRPRPEDRPKHKKVIPNCAPWVLIYTKLGRRFVHNTETQESYWKFPEDVMKAVIEFDRLKLDQKLGKQGGEGTGANNVPVKQNDRRRRSASLQREDEEALAAELAAAEQEHEVRPAATTAVGGKATSEAPGGEDEGSSSEYEEIEVTDDEEEENDAHRERQAGESGSAAPEGPVEFNEEDIAYQLAQMEESYGLDPGEYGGGEEYEEGAEGLPLTEEDSAALFKDMLDDFHINPYTPWEKLIEDGYIIEDDRYTVLTTMKARRECYDVWSRERIADLKAARAKMEKQDPRIPYLAFLAEKVTPKLYWPEFKRKFKKEPELRDTKLPDKDKEKLYREHVARMKLPQSQLRSDLAALMKSLPIHVLNKDVNVEQLPKEMLVDVRYISLEAKVRDPLIRAYLDTLPPKPEGGETAEEAAEKEKKNKDREKREAAMRERERRVEEEKRKRERDQRIGMAQMRERERELEQAMRVGRGGLRAQLEGDNDAPSDANGAANGSA
ncbi:hypothetical protein M8818_001224 [Zalaria obscura]|uniref:Uncharacterized protein n=1 Tax=Zalaria obscura TaxID=2024903 RepID=A0ACC3SL18_9PEZI